jgi:TonB family protein
MFRDHGKKLKRAAVVALLAAWPAFWGANLRAQEARKVLAHPAPGYPDAARRYGITGAVKVQVVIAPDGHIKDMKILGGHPLLANAVEDTLKTWKYAPAPGETTTVLQFDFHP